MRAVVQRVRRGSVTVEGETIAQIDKGFVILLGVAKGDTEEAAKWLAKKCAGLRVFEDDAGLMNLSLGDVGGRAIVVSQFTLYGDSSRGKRPSFTDSAPAELAEPLYRVFVEAMRSEGIEVSTGKFQAKMQVDIANDGPVTLILER
ncbi:MAG TPA: D-aminoacyl-tRNA deacylase [bacterium]|nr:D-aminoacyl-tRNA deacylase [bacterium]